MRRGRHRDEGAQHHRCGAGGRGQSDDGVARAERQVLIAHERGALLADQIGTDDGRGITEAVRHLFDKGLYEIAFVSGPEVEPLGAARLATPGIVRLAAVRKAVKSCGGAVRDDWVEHATYTRDGGFTAGPHLLTNPDRPRVIMCANDLMAFGVMDAVRAAGLAVPVEIGVVGFDDVNTANLITPRLPASIGGVALLRSLRGPFPTVPIMPTGGVNPGNLGDWLAAGAVGAVGAGSELCSPALLRDGRWSELTERARAFAEAFRRFTS